MTGMGSGMLEAELDALCGGLPGARRALRWEVDLVWSVSGKAFAVLSTLGPDRGKLSFRAEAERFAELSTRAGMMAAPLGGSPFWIRVTEPERFSAEELARFVRRSYELARASLSPRQQAALEGKGDA